MRNSGILIRAGTLLLAAWLQSATLASETTNKTSSVEIGRSLFLRNCTHCHGSDATGDEGPDLHGLKHSDEWIARRIRNGVKGEMTAFGEKFSSLELEALIAFLRSLRAEE